MQQIDSAIAGFDKILRVVTGATPARRPNPAGKLPDVVMTEEERRHSAGLMRVNHVGEVCAQALYESQGLFASKPHLRKQFAQAGIEEEDHLAWTADRLKELGSHTSLLNPLWYAGAFAIGVLAAKAGDAHSLGFVVETERQVEAHLEGHLDSLPPQDARSRAIVDQMRLDEIEHGATAKALGAAQTPAPIQALMKAAAKVMTTAAYRI